MNPENNWVHNDFYFASALQYLHGYCNEYPVMQAAFLYVKLRRNCFF